MSSWVRQYYNNDSLLIHQDVLHALNPKKWGLVKKNPAVPPVSFSGMDEGTNVWTDTMQLEDEKFPDGGQDSFPLQFNDEYQEN